MAGLWILGIWLFFIVGGCLNIYQVIVSWIGLEAVAEASGYLIVKTVSIFLGPVGSIWGWVELF